MYIHILFINFYKLRKLGQILLVEFQHQIDNTIFLHNSYALKLDFMLYIYICFYVKNITKKYFASIANSYDSYEVSLKGIIWTILNRIPIVFFKLLLVVNFEEYYVGNNINNHQLY